MKFLFSSRSITARLIMAVLAVELLSSILVVAFSFGYERHTHFHAFDVLLHGHADSVLGAIEDAEDANDDVILDFSDLHSFPDDIYEVYDSAGHLLGRSPNWQGQGFVLPGNPRGEFFNLTLNRRDYRALRIQGSRLVDPADHGGKVRNVVILYGAPTNKVWHAIYGTVEFYAGGTLFLLLVTGPLIAWLLHRGLFPLRQLATLAGRVSVDSWHFNPPSSAHTTPELAPLTHALESVLQRLQVSFEQQRAFVSDAAHELKTAVAVAKSSLQLLAMKRRSPDDYQAGLERCLTDSERLEELVAEMLTLARIEAAPVSGPNPSHPPSSDFAPAVRQTVATLQSVADLRGIHINLTLDDSTPISVPVPHNDLFLLLSNLLLNALQHSPAETTVSLRLAVEAQSAFLTIEDHGDGIAPDALPHVFDRFYRGDPSRNRNTGGTGLGLAIARAITVKAGGSIQLASELGRSTTATIRLPFTTNTPSSSMSEANNQMGLSS
jgi:signal transduction histidine kinase